MIVYHGSHVDVQKPDLNHGRAKLDFGKGFYVTTIQTQAEKWVGRQAKLKMQEPTVSVYEFITDNLNILSFNGYTEEWLDFVVDNRKGASQMHSYDAIYGNIADDDVATIVNDYIRLLRMGRINQESKSFYLGQLQYCEPNNQYCIAAQKGLTALKFLESYKLEARYV